MLAVLLQNLLIFWYMFAFAIIFQNMRRFTVITILFFSLGVVAVFAISAYTSQGFARSDVRVFVKQELPFKAPRPLFVPNEIIVKFKDGVSESAIKGLELSENASEKYVSPFSGFRVLKIPSEMPGTQMGEIFQKNVFVEDAEAKYYAYEDLMLNETIEWR